METQQAIFPSWMRGILLAAAAYNILWGVFISWMPDTFYSWVLETPNLEAPRVIFWQGRAVLLMTVLYLSAALHPGKLWFFPLIGALTKIGGAAWFYVSILDQEVGKRAIFHLVMNDLVWVPIFIWFALAGKRYKDMKNA